MAALGQYSSRALQLHPHLSNASSGTCDNGLDHFVGMCSSGGVFIDGRGSSGSCGVGKGAIEAPRKVGERER